MNPVKVTLTTFVIVGLVLAAFVLPLPVGRVRQVALVQLQSEGQIAVPIRETAVLSQLYVRDGQYVEAGTVLAEFTSLDLSNKLSDEEAQCEIYQKQVNTVQRALQQTTDISEKEHLREQSVEAVQNLHLHGGQREAIRRRLENLKLLAPRSGTVISPPRMEDLGKLFEAESPDRPRPFCLIGDPNRLRVAMPVSPSDYHLLETDLKALREKGQELEIEIRVQGRDADTWKGRLVQLPQEDAHEIPGPLASTMGGPIAVKPGSQSSGHFVPQSQQYLLYIDLVDADRAIRPGNMAQVKIHCRWRTAAWWVWRTISNTFDLGLI